METMRYNMLMNNGKGLFMDCGDSVVNILPPGVDPRAIAHVEHYARHETNDSVIYLQFKNGHQAYLSVDPERGVCDEHLKEFQATCIMVHDI